MDGLFNDVRFWLCTVGVIFSALLSKIISSYDKQLDNLFKMERENKEAYLKEAIDIKETLKEQDKDIDALHSLIAGHIEYHRGLDKK